MTHAPRLAVIGLDSAPPELVFDRFASDLPVLTGLRRRSVWGPLQSVVPPITVPAWSCMMSGRTPGELGIYGFRNRTGRGYDQLGIATSAAVRLPRIWDLVGEAGGESVLLGVPGTYPPPPIRGSVVGDFLAPSTSSDYTYPSDLRDEVREMVGEYVLDVEDFRSDDKNRIAQQLFDMTEQRFKLARALTTTRPWTFFAMVDMGPDRLHHGFWKYCDPCHPRHEPGGPHLNLFRDYYRALDRHVAELLETFDDDTYVLVVSDHGAKAMQGGFCLNEWLVERGLLVLAEPVAGRTPIGAAKIDWRKTTAWGDGGYYGRVFLNVAGREPEGTIPPAKYDQVRDSIAASLEGLTDHRGRSMGNRALRPEMVYPEVVGFPPDLIVYFGDLEWRAVGTLGLGCGLHTFENDTGPDDANHSETGIAMLSGPGVTPGHCAGMSLLDIAPTIQSLIGLTPPPGQRGLVRA